jgi:uncharacterized protein YecE (DUF72 family)
MAKLIIGTCSWKYDSWQGLVYSPDVINHLAEYAQKYNSVEVDQWFWSLHADNKISLPLASVVQSYVESVPTDFIFTVKAPNSLTLTHHYQKDKSKPLAVNAHFLSTELYSRFLESLAPLQGYLGPILFQFEYLNKLKMASQAEFLNHCRRFLQSCERTVPIAVEIRNPNYLNQAYFDFLQTSGAAHVFLEGYYMPLITDIYQKWGDRLRGTVVIRLHGPDRQGMEEKSGLKWDRILQPKDGQLAAIAGMIENMLRRDLDVFLNVNNHYEGSAPLTIERIKKLLSIPPV